MRSAVSVVIWLCAAPRVGGLMASAPVACARVVPTPLACAARASTIRCSSAEDDLGAEEGIEENVELLKKTRKGTFKAYKPKDERDRLLYAVTEVTPPPTKLGTFRLSPNAGCGDLISAPVRAGGRGNAHTYVIKRVSYRYSYQSGSYRMVGKEVDVKKTSRDATEAFLERLLPRDADGAEDRTCPPDDDELSQQQQRRRQRRRQESDE